MPAEGEDRSCPHSFAPSEQRRIATGLKRANPHNASGTLSKKPRSLHLHGDDTDDGKLLQVRTSIYSLSFLPAVRLTPLCLPSNLHRNLDTSVCEVYACCISSQTLK